MPSLLLSGWKRSPFSLDLLAVGRSDCVDPHGDPAMGRDRRSQRLRAFRAVSPREGTSLDSGDDARAGVACSSKRLRAFRRIVAESERAGVAEVTEQQRQQHRQQRQPPRRHANASGQSSTPDSADGGTYGYSKSFQHIIDSLAWPGIIIRWKTTVIVATVVA